MARLRYVKSPEQLKAQREAGSPKLDSTVRSIRIVYETDPALHRAVIPQPLEPAERPEMLVTLSHVAMHITPEFTFEIGSAIFGVKARYDGDEGIYLITMPMTTEQAVVPGRETYGEPKKIAEIDFQQQGDAVGATVTRMGCCYLEARGSLGAVQGPREFTEYAWCFKAFPSCEKGGDFDSDPLLVRLEWHHTHEEVRDVEGEIILRDSPFDPVVDVPVRKLVKMEYEVGTTRSNGKVLRSIPGAWLLPFLHQRYDDASGDGIDIAGV
jgi:acetoacetate decarboxylase